MGRRLYIHKNSFDFLAHQDVRLCNAVEVALGRVRVMKLLRHYCDDNWIPLGLVSVDAARSLLAPFAGSLQELTSLLREVDNENAYDGALVRLLNESDEIIASCYEGGYFTFATDAASSETMYDDHERLKSLWEAVYAGDGPLDLTMTRGPRLFAQESRGLSTLASHKKRRQGLRVAPAVHQSVKQLVRESLVAEVASTSLPTFGDLSDELTSGVRRVLDGARCEICVTA